MMMSKLSLVNKLSSPPLSSSSRSRDKAGDVSRGHRSSSLSFRNMMSKLSLVDELSSPPLSSSSRSRDKAGDVSRSNRSSSLSLRNMMSKLSLVNKLSSPPLSSSSLSLSPLSNSHMMHITVWEVRTWKSLSEGDMVYITERIVCTGELSGGLYWDLRGSGGGLDEAGLVDLVILRQQRVVTVGVGGTEGLQVIRELAS